jgi:hypothetical protein
MHRTESYVEHSTTAWHRIKTKKINNMIMAHHHFNQAINTVTNNITHSPDMTDTVIGRKGDKREGSNDLISKKRHATDAADGVLKITENLRQANSSREICRVRTYMEQYEGWICTGRSGIGKSRNSEVQFYTQEYDGHNIRTKRMHIHTSHIDCFIC